MWVANARSKPPPPHLPLACQLLPPAGGKISWGCCGASCAVPGCDKVAGRAHQMPHTCFRIDDFAAQNAAMGVDGQTCWRDLKKVCV